MPGPNSPTTPLTWIRNFWTDRFAGERVQFTVAASARISASDTSGGSGTSTPRMLMSSGTGFQSVCHALRTSL
jgi:hypothetical protein